MEVKRFEIKELSKLADSPDVNDVAGYHDFVCKADKEPMSRIVDMPPRLPFAFSMGRMHVLSKRNGDEGPEWFSVDWPAKTALPSGMTYGEIYITDGRGHDYVKISEDENGEWGWRNLDEIEEEERIMSRRTGRIDWEFKEYFPSSGEYLNVGQLNANLNERGYAIYGYEDGRGKAIPEGLSSERLTDSFIEDVMYIHHLVYDPERADVIKVNPQKVSEEDLSNLKLAGYGIIDATPRRDIYVRSRAEYPDEYTYNPVINDELD